MMCWHLLMTKPQEDARADVNLRNQGFEVFRPLLRRFKLRKGAQKAVIEPLFSRYLFIRLDNELSNWSKIRSTRGVKGLVRFSELPVVVPDALINELKSQVDSDNILDQTQVNTTLFRPGDHVEIIDGSFKGLQAIVKEQKVDMRVTLLLEMMGKTQSLSIPLVQLENLTEFVT